MEYKMLMVVLGVFAAIIGCYLWMAKHITNSKKHPCKEDIVYRDVCEAERGRIEDCVESELKNVNRRLDEQRSDMKDGFSRLESLIKNGR